MTSGSDKPDCDAVLKSDGSIDGELTFVGYLKGQLKLGINPIVFCVGPPRSGKSWSLIGVLEKARGLTLDHIIFPVKEFVGAVKNMENGALLADDFGMGMAARAWQNIFNQVGGLVFQSFGFKLILVGVTAPDEDFVDSQPRRLYTSYIQMDPRTEEGPPRARVFVTERNARTKKIYDHRLRVYHPDKGILRLSGVRFSGPTPALAEPYMAKKRIYLMERYEDLYQQLEDADVIGRKGDTARAWMVVVLCDYGRALGLTQTEIAKDIGVDPTSLSRALRRAREATAQKGRLASVAPVLASP